MDQPYLKIVHGDATPEEVAALVIAVAGRTVSAPPNPTPSGNWRNPVHRLRRGVIAGPGGWRAAARPH
ncbi:acyl-CoA carboxylase subunit epsilon [Sphaerisporangium rufum]|uniref:acyl-CoA carboxylase subunit epsilon n=1 Tax=Sphaerisporangium rufum TaxID=1381558 RepID=UPI0019513583